MTLAKEILKKTYPLKYLENNKQEKINRDSFLYLEPDLFIEAKGDKKKYAQCETCMMFTGDHCSIHGKEIKITKNMSCGLYVNGMPEEKMKGHEMTLIVPKESGLINRQVRCENCISYDNKKNICNLFDTLNKNVNFDLNIYVNPLGCCNAQRSKK